MVFAIDLACVAIATVVCNVRRARRALAYVVNVAWSYARCGTWFSTRVAAWSGDPVVGRPAHGQLCTFALPVMDGRPICGISRGGFMGSLDAGRISRDAPKIDTNVLTASLKVQTIGDHVLEADVSHLCYSIPVAIGATAEELALLMFGMEKWDTMVRAEVEVVTMEMTYRFGDRDHIDDLFFNPSCKDHEDGPCVARPGSARPDGSVRGVDESDA